MSGTSKPDLCYQERGRVIGVGQNRRATTGFLADANKDGRVVYA